MKANTIPLKNSIANFRGIRRTYLYLRRANRLIVLLICAALFLAVVLAGLFGYLLIQDLSQSGRIFKGVTIDGNPVGGLSKAEATERVNQKVVSPLSRPIVVYHDSEEISLDPASINLKINIKKMVDTAYWAGQDQNIIARMFRRFFGKPVHINVPVMVDFDSAKLKKFISGVASEVNYGPRSASISVSEGYPVIKSSRYGLEVKQEETYKAISTALSKHQRKVPLVTASIKPEVTEGDIGKIIVIQQSQHTLYLYNREDLINSYLIAVGTEKYPTPNGRFHITFKEEDPVWLPTSEWAEDKRGIPQPPGPDNPLGSYWMDIGGGIGIHATPYENTLGESVSHGCIRMATWAAEEVFFAVKVGTPVFIIP